MYLSALQSYNVTFVVYEQQSIIAAAVSVWFQTVRCMMYGFGDDQNPYSESVDLLEDLVIEYISEMVCLSAN